MSVCYKLSLSEQRLSAPGAMVEGLGKRNSLLGQLNQEKVSLELLVNIMSENGNENEIKRGEGKAEASRQAPEDLV